MRKGKTQETPGRGKLAERMRNDISWAVLGNLAGHSCLDPVLDLLLGEPQAREAEQ